METISVIIPAFNAGKWIASCLDSVLTQEGDFSLEIIVVDDGSTDNTLHILSRYTGKINIISQPHSGQSTARNQALDVAAGQWIMFVDADDQLLPGAINHLLDTAESTKVQIVCASYTTSHSYISRGARHAMAMTSLIDSNDALATILYRTDKTLNSSMWGKLFDRNLFNGIRFWDGHIYEDLEIIPRLFLQTNNIAATCTQVYFYRHNPDSTLSRWCDRRKDMLDVVNRIMHIPDIAKNPELRRAALDRSFSAACNCLINMLRNNDSDRATRDRCLKIIRATRRSTIFNRRARLRNRLTARLLPF